MITEDGYKMRLEHLAGEILSDWHTANNRHSDRRPPIVTLCGSTKFKEEFLLANQVFTHAGIMVLTVGSFIHTDGFDGVIGADKEAVLGEKQAEVLDDLHRSKVRHGDYVLILNKNGYVGDSTFKEFKTAKDAKVKVFWLEELSTPVYKIVNRMVKAEKAIADAIAVQQVDGNWNYSPYMHGLLNGMLFAQHCLRDLDDLPPYVDAPDVWLQDVRKERKDANAKADEAIFDAVDGESLDCGILPAEVVGAEFYGAKEGSSGSEDKAWNGPMPGVHEIYGEQVAPPIVINVYGNRS